MPAESNVRLCKVCMLVLKILTSTCNLLNMISQPLNFACVITMFSQCCLCLDMLILYCTQCFTWEVNNFNN